MNTQSLQLRHSLNNEDIEWQPDHLIHTFIKDCLCSAPNFASLNGDPGIIFIKKNVIVIMINSDKTCTPNVLKHIASFAPLNFQN